MTTPPEPEPTPGAAAAESFAQMHIMAETTVGYRKTLVDGGITPEVADRMAEAFHTALVNNLEAMMKQQQAAQAADTLGKITTALKVGGQFPKHGR